ncbi:MAG: aldo/keto reductase [Armatimonadetes bacterium]|nr:aldo/keto reductase [Armatimonadota bacterium]
MTTRPLPHTDLVPSRLCLGLGDYGTRVAGEAAVRLLARFMELGGNFVDTAHCYSFWVAGAGAGSSERQLGAAMRELGCRDRLIVATKGGHPEGGEAYPRPDHYMAPEVVSQDLAESLERLGIATVDLYLLHRDDPRVPVGEVMDALNEHLQAGRVRYLGASNWSVERIAAANLYAAERGLQGFCVSQVHWSLAEPPWEMGPDPTTRCVTLADAAWHTATGLPIMAYSPSAGGYFAGRGESYDTSTNAARRERAGQLADEMGLTPAQVALAYLLNQPFPVYPIVGTMSEAHLVEAMGAAEVRLTPEQVAWLRDGDAP